MTDTPKPPDLDRLRLQVEIWKESIAVTRHFTEMSVKMRQMGLTFVVAAVALAVTMLTQFPTARISFPVSIIHGRHDYDVHLGGLLIISAAIGLAVTKLLDVKLYHRMLRGSVVFTQEIERAGLRDNLMGTPEGLAESISTHSQSAKALGSSGQKQTARLTSAEWKISRFYNLSICFVVTIGAMIAIVTTERVEKRTIINQRIEFPARK